MSCEAGAENRRIVVRPCVDAEVDGRAAFHINHHPEFDHPQSKAVHIGQSWDAAASESVAMVLKTTDEARHAADDIC
jgi:hypothetical protein